MASQSACSLRRSSATYSRRLCGDGEEITADSASETKAVEDARIESTEAIDNAVPRNSIRLLVRPTDMVEVLENVVLESVALAIQHPLLLIHEQRQCGQFHVVDDNMEAILPRRSTHPVDCED
jgi:hypothetical protein